MPTLPDSDGLPFREFSCGPEGDRVTFRVRERVTGVDRLEVKLAETAVERWRAAIVRGVAGWSGVTGKDGREAEFSWDSLVRLSECPGFENVIEDLGAFVVTNTNLYLSLERLEELKKTPEQSSPRV